MISNIYNKEISLAQFQEVQYLPSDIIKIILSYNQTECYEINASNYLDIIIKENKNFIVGVYSIISICNPKNFNQIYKLEGTKIRFDIGPSDLRINKYTSDIDISALFPDYNKNTYFIQIKEYHILCITNQLELFIGMIWFCLHKKIKSAIRFNFVILDILNYSFEYIVSMIDT